MATRTRSIWDPQIVQRAIGDSFRKLHPRTMARNPVMFVVEIGSVLTTLSLAQHLVAGGGEIRFELQITFWLWLTVLFANFAEAMAEGRGKAQADALRKAKTETTANRERPGGTYERVAAPSLRKGDIVTMADDRPVRSAAQLRNTVGLARIGQELKLTVQRNGSPSNVIVKVAPQQRPSNGSTSSIQ